MLSSQNGLFYWRHSIVPLALKNINLGILWTFERSFSKRKIGKTPTSHIIHLLGGEYWIARDSEPVRLLKTQRPLSVYIFRKGIIRHRMCMIGSFVIRLTIVTLFLITPFRPLTAGLYRAMVSIYWAGLLVIAWLTSSSTAHQHARELYCSSSHVGHACVNIKYNLIKLSFRSY